jgi:hypothetical protein
MTQQLSAISNSRNLSQVTGNGILFLLREPCTIPRQVLRAARGSRYGSRCFPGHIPCQAHFSKRGFRISVNKKVKFLQDFSANAGHEH